MDWKSIYLKDRIIEEIKKGNILNDILHQNGTFWLKELEDNIPGIKDHIIEKNSGDVVIKFSYFLDHELLNYEFEIDAKKEIRDYKLNKLLNGI